MRSARCSVRPGRRARGGATATAAADEQVATAPLRLDGIAVHHSLAPTTLAAHPGEVVGLAGLDGSGAHVVLDVIFGRRRPDSGTITLPSGAAGATGMTAAVRAGVAYVPADRKRARGDARQADLRERRDGDGRSAAADGRDRCAARRMIARAEHWRDVLKIKAPSSRVPVGALSGGNQQKVVFAKWLEADPQVVLLDDPSRGVDVGAKREMHTIIAQMRERRRIVVYTSNDLEEMAEVCDRVIVFFQGRACGELAGDELSEHRLLESINTGVIDPEGVVA